MSNAFVSMGDYEAENAKRARWGSLAMLAHRIVIDWKHKVETEANGHPEDMPKPQPPPDVQLARAVEFLIRDLVHEEHEVEFYREYSQRLSDERS